MTDAFKKAAEQYSGCLTIDLGEEVVAQGWLATKMRGSGSNHGIPDSSWEDFLEHLGEEKVDADFDGEEFVVIYKPLKIEVRDTGATQALARLWLKVNERKFAKFSRS